MNSCELILSVVIPLFIFLCFDPSISAWSSVGAFSFAVFMLLDEQSIVRARVEVHASQLLLLLPSSVHHCVIEWTSKTYSASRHVTMIFIFIFCEEGSLNSGEIGGWAPVPVNCSARRRVDWISPQMSAWLTPLSPHHSIFTPRRTRRREKQFLIFIEQMH